MNKVGESKSETLYTRQFFQVFAAVVLFMTANSLQYHFGQYIEFLGYGVDTLGHVLSMSMVGVLLIRLQIGQWIDRFGCRTTWIAASAFVAVMVGSIQFAKALWLIVPLRMASMMATACAMTTVAVFAAQIAPPTRRAESIGTLGLAGFMGMIIGPSLGDWIFGGATDSIAPYRVFFTASAGFSALAGLIMLRPIARPGTTTLGGSSAAITASPGARTPVLRMIRSHWPGTILIVGVVFSMVFCLQSAFLERLAEQRGFKDVKVFFLAYAPTAMTLRVIFRRLPERFGRTRTLLAGLALQAAGLLCLVGTTQQWHLALPGLVMGAGHCFVFPSMVDLSAERLPMEHRGLGTSLILGAGDVGTLTGYFVVGELIDAYGFDVSLAALAVTVVTGAAMFGAVQRKAVFRRRAAGRPAGEGHHAPQ